MNQAPKLTRRARWAIPSGAVAAVGVVVAGSVLTSAAAAPSLQPRTPAQLIAAIAGNKSVPTSLSGTIVANAALGLPALPGTGDPASVASLLAGSHTIKIWYARPGQLRLALPVPLGETDLRVNGRQVWLWDSQRNTATHILPPGPLAAPSGSMSWSGRSGSTSWSAKPRSSARFSSPGSSASSSTAYQSTLVTSAPTPQQIARQLLAAVGPTTTLGVQSNVTIAGRAAYQLTLAPKNAQSLIGRVSIAVDASRYFPLRVQVFARGATSPAFQIGYTAISFARPAASNFAFTPPPGAKVKTVRPSVGPLMGGFPPGALRGASGGSVRPPRHLILRHGKIVGPNGARKAALRLLPIKRAQCTMRAVPMPKGSLTMNPARAAKKRTSIVAPKHLSKTQRQQLLKMLRQGIARASCLPAGPGWHGAGWYAYSPLTNTTFPPGLAGAPRVIGSGWTAVGVLPAAGLTGQAGGEAGALLRSATAVHGSWGSGRLLRTSLISVLITSNGRALIGAVTPSVLYAAAAQAK